ncbi:MAG: polysaccharide biosynthesis protein [Planctomycetales bacterium]|nr:polysaccharide biosynthesis protein [Planctomycetales bacterium]
MTKNKLVNLFSRVALLAPVGAVAYVAAFLLRFDGVLDAPETQRLYSSILWVAAIKIAVMVYSRLHLEFNRYVTFHDMVTIVRTVTFSSVAITLVDAMLMSQVTIPRSVILLDWGATLFLLATLRTLPRLIRDSNWNLLTPSKGKTALIVGANDSGEALLRSIRRSADLAHRPIGFVDQRPHVQGRRIAGVPVLGTHNDIALLAARHQVEEVLITTGSLSGKEVRKLVELADQHDFRVKVVPSYEQLIHEKVAVNPRPVAIADLLRRPSVTLDTDGIRHWVANRTVMVTGSAGSIGSEICRQLLSYSVAKLILVDRSETGQFFIERELHRLDPEANLEVALADLTDRARLQSVFDEHKPDIIFHAAAYKHVPLMERHVGEAVKNIVFATRNLVDLAEEHGAEGLVMISTDKAVNPTSVMGSCKRLAEQYVQAKADTSSCRLVTVRFGNVLDSAGSVVPVFREQIARGGPVTVTHPEMIRYFMLIPEAAQLVVQAGAMGQGGEIFVLDMGDPVRIMDLAKDMIRLSGLRVGDDIEIEVTGLRPGEKLYEELYSDHELHVQTKHDKIMVAKGKTRSLLNVLHDLGQLAEVLEEPNELIRQRLSQIIPVQEPAKAKPAAAILKVA